MLLAKYSTLCDGQIKSNTVYSTKPHLGILKLCDFNCDGIISLNFADFHCESAHHQIYREACLHHLGISDMNIKDENKRYIFVFTHL